MTNEHATVLRTLDAIPDGLLACDARELAAQLGGSTLIRIAGDRSPALFVSVLLHGNETSGWEALRRYLLAVERPGRSLVVFIGNVLAAAHGQRALAGQPDYNRIWCGAAAGGVEQELALALEAELVKQPLFAAIDLHNNTGRNPHYSVLTNFAPQALVLAREFSEKAVYIEEPATVLTRLLQQFCPTVALEVGPVGDAASDDRTLTALHRYCELESLDGDVPELELHRSLGRVHIPVGASFDFADASGGDADITLTSGMEAVNFHVVPEGTEFASTACELTQVLTVLDPAHQVVTDKYFRAIDGRITFARDVVPAMYTVDRSVIRQDCLCYLMERFEVPPLQR
ncbi:MAG: succinylglutamate desuccinylase/aspartoacylase family protein [Pseudomonadaceae bacterium]|nr:succinylglutamate desuccinylase/aspartoacylase family protein [Pseudomonadaceae bacterium]